jgi:hypothetical protein
VTSQRFAVTLGTQALRRALGEGDPAAVRTRLEAIRGMLGDDFTPLFGLDFAALAAFAAPFVDPADREVIADLASVSAATGTRSTGGRIVLRTVLALNSEAPG